MTTGADPAGNVYLTGFSYTGKSTVGGLLATRLGHTYIDTDEQIERRTGRSIPEIFRTEGEVYFRELETELLKELADQKARVVSTGGGIVLDPLNRELMAQAGAIVCLEARAETILKRLRQAADNESDRPLLQLPNPLDEIRLLKARRQRYYSEADVTVHTDALDVDGVVESIVAQLRGTGRPHRAPSEDFDPDVAYKVETEITSYSIVVGTGVLHSIGNRVRGLGFSGTAHIVVDGAIEGSYGQTVGESLRGAGFGSRTFVLPPGEGSKTVEKAGEIYEWLAAGKAERRDVLVAIGGGVAGDLGGFVAATYARGLSFVQVPTTVLAMADASIGGKVAVDLATGKNLVGAFYQPSLIVADISVLKTLPTRDRIAGWAEVVKTGLIADEELVSFLESNAPGLTGGDEALMRHALARCAAIKGRAVSLDERETTGLRATLNYGHTLGHAIETATGFEGVLHGEAVAMGMSFAGRLAVEMGRLSQGDLSRQEALIAAFGLPPGPPDGIDIDAIRTTMSLDKKVESGRNRWVLLDRIGHAQLRGDVDPAIADGLLERFFVSK